MKKYLADSGTVHQILENALKSKDSFLPEIEGKIRQARSRLETAMRSIDKFSEALQVAALDPTKNLLEVSKVLIDEKARAQTAVEELEAEIRSLEEQKVIAKSKFENSTLPEYLQKVLGRFDRMSGGEKKKVIQTVIPRIVIDPAIPDKIELFINPDPNGTSPHSVCTVGQKVRFKENWWT